MKEIINRKLYNTETAEEIATHSNNLSYRDFRWFEETLYKKRTGEFFLYGEGGPMSRYAESAGNRCWIEGERIIPLTLDEAKEWVSKHASVDTYITLFGEVEE